MNGDLLIERVRDILQDKESATVLGEFYHDLEIVLSLNAAQDFIVNFCVRTQFHYYLNGLIKTTAYLTSPTTLPSDYLHGISAISGAEISLHPARLYIGGLGYTYMGVDHNSCIILNNQLYFLEGGVHSGGKLIYYKKPSYIGATSLGLDVAADFNDKDFYDFIYNDIFVQNACVLLGLKEPQTQREYKKIKKVMKELLTQPIKDDLFYDGTTSNKDDADAA